MQPTFTTLDNFGHSLHAQSYVVRARNEKVRFSITAIFSNNF